MTGAPVGPVTEALAGAGAAAGDTWVAAVAEVATGVVSLTGILASVLNPAVDGEFVPDAVFFSAYRQVSKSPPLLSQPVTSDQ